MKFLKRAVGRLFRLRNDALKGAVRSTTPLWHTRPVIDLGPPIAVLRAEMEAATSTSTTPEWSEYCAALKFYVAHNNPAKFLQWPVILETMNVQGSGYIETEFHYLRRGDWKKWRRVLQESSVGGNYPYFLYPWTTDNSVHHCYHLARFVEATGVSISSFGKIFEYGGGYGNLCRIIRAVGFKKEYVITDLPQFHALQRFYLRCVGTEASLLPFSTCSSWLSNQKLSDVLFIATWSFSESELAHRQVVETFLPLFSALLIAFQNKFSGIDNVAYFEDLKDRVHGTHQCSIVEIDHLPGNFYFFAHHR
jgi:hypothetical protein